MVLPVVQALARKWGNMDRAGHRAAQGHGHPSDPARNRPAAKPRPMKHLDMDAFIEAQFAQPSRFGHGEPFPIDRGDGGVLPPRQCFEADRNHYTRGHIHDAIDYQ